jgi:hypothetical protein
LIASFSSRIADRSQCDRVNCRNAKKSPLFAVSNQILQNSSACASKSARYVAAQSGPEIAPISANANPPSAQERPVNSPPDFAIDANAKIADKTANAEKTKKPKFKSDNNESAPDAAERIAKTDARFETSSSAAFAAFATLASALKASNKEDDVFSKGFNLSAIATAPLRQKKEKGGVSGFRKRRFQTI